MKVERCAASGACYKCKKKIDGKKSNEDKEEGITLQWSVCCSKSKNNEE